MVEQTTETSGVMRFPRGALGLAGDEDVRPHGDLLQAPSAALYTGQPLQEDTRSILRIRF